MSSSLQTPPTAAAFGLDVDAKLLDHVGVVPADAEPAELMMALSQLARDQLSKRWVNTQAVHGKAGARRVCYMSMEFLIGRTMGNALAALDLEGPAAAAMQARARLLEDVAAQEADAALGNGGLGRLAACFLDSMATLGLPSFGYGIRYEYGMFQQEIRNGVQIEHPDPWLENGTVWEFPRASVSYPVHFGGWVEPADRTVGAAALWHPDGEVQAKACDMVVPGHGTEAVSTLRLWNAVAALNIDLDVFNSGDYARAATAKNEYENISWVLYPNDSTPAGRALRLRQEYFFVSASMQDLIARHLHEHVTLANLADKVAIHLNDTHPAIAVAELMRLLCDGHGMAWSEAWGVCGRVFSYTNHTLMPEALETWPVALMEQVLPRHMMIIFRINQDMLDGAAARHPG
ncbi:MAG: glycogen/starch/alpha-glucan phosphorylase, partial [Caldimonas sp.]